MSATISLYKALQHFADSVREKSGQFVPGEPKDQLRAPFENFMGEAAAEWGLHIVCAGEAPLPDRLGRSDFAIFLNRLLVGYVELKAPGAGANARRFTGRNRKQFKRFASVPNMLYADGNEWALYRNGERIHKIARLPGDIVEEGAGAVNSEAAASVQRILHDFLQWDPQIPVDREGRVELKQFAALLAPLCRMLRDDASDALDDASSPLAHLAEDWRRLLFPNASDEQFADSYAQTVTFALLLARSEGADPLTLEKAIETLNAQHTLLSRALQILTDARARSDIAASLDLLLRVVAAVPQTALAGTGEDPWLYFYEDFLAAYDPALRKDAGVYYTPVEVVRAQVRLIDDLLVSRLRRRYGFASEDVITLDPAAGTGTYLLGVIDYVLRRSGEKYGPGVIPGIAHILARTLYGFELMVGPYAVADLRVSRALADAGTELPSDGVRIYLTDTLESPNAEIRNEALYLQPISEQRRKALEIKNETTVMVCLGNPPYDRHEAVADDNIARAGNWVRWGDGKGAGEAILDSFAAPAKKAGHGGHLKNLYNLYVYFWRWALWKVFEQNNAPGVVSFVSASSYLDGRAFAGMRQHMRWWCDDIWILDLGGEGRGAHKGENVFDVQTPVAIAVALRSDKAKQEKMSPVAPTLFDRSLNTDKEKQVKPARVCYARIGGTRKEKLAALDAIDGFDHIQWEKCPSDWQAPFRPKGKGDYFAWPLLTNLMPWQHSGIQLKRTWPIAPDPDTLERRWRALLKAKGKDRAEAFRETEDRAIAGAYRGVLTGKESDSTPIAQLPRDAPLPGARRYAYRSFDRQYVIADIRLMSRPRPDLWRAHSERQIYLTSLLSQALGSGPALTSAALLPDLDYFRGSYGAKATIPLYCSADASDPNILPGLLDLLGQTWKRAVTPEDFLAYLYGVASQPAFTERFEDELETRELRIPITRDSALFEQARGAGAELLWLHTYGERFAPAGEETGRVPAGDAQCIRIVPQKASGYPEKFSYDAATRTLHVGYGAFAPVSPAVFEFEVSGLKVVQSWLKYRMKKGAGRKSSPLDDIRPESWAGWFSRELLELLWILEKTVAGYPAQETLLKAIVEGDCFQATEFPMPPERMRTLKGAGTHGALL